jgi:hypothetical protein
MNEDRPPLEDLRAAFASLSANAAPGPDCPVPDSIWEALRGGMSARSTAVIVEHTSRCHACAEAWRLGHELAGQRRADEGAVARARALAFRAPAFGVWASLAAAALLLILVGIGIVMPPKGQQPIVTRAGEEKTIQSLVEGTAPLRRDACVLKWSAPAAGTRYTLRVGTQDLTPIASVRGLEQPEYQVPQKKLDRLPPGATIVWRVEADLPDGRHVASQAFMNKIE